jgi:CHRD domain
MRHWKIGTALLVLVLGVLLSLGVTAGGAKKKASSSVSGVATTLSGKNEISPAGKKRAGDLNGFGVFAATTEGGKLCYALAVGGIDTPAAAHVHKAKRNKNGPIVIPLTHPTSGDPGASSACVTPDPALLAAIRKHPNRYYVNVHTGTFPDGAVRGQLKKSKSK